MRCPSRYPPHSRRIIEILIDKICRFHRLLLLLFLYSGSLPPRVVQRHDPILLSYLLLIGIWSHHGLGISLADVTPASTSATTTATTGISTAATRPHSIGMRWRRCDAPKWTGVRCSGGGSIEPIIATAARARSP